MPSMRLSWITSPLAAALIIAGCGRSTIGTPQIATVIEVIDGDTVDLSIAGDRQRVRLIGVDTPETKHPEKPIECYGPEATSFVESLLPRGTNVRLERDVEARDSYDRLLVYLYRKSDNMFINMELVRQGFAHLLTIEPNIAYFDKFVTAARAAQSNKRGLWQACPG